MLDHTIGKFDNDFLKPGELTKRQEKGGRIKWIKTQRFLKMIGRRRGSREPMTTWTRPYKPGTHEMERGEVTWHQLRTTENIQDVAKESPGKSTRRRKIARNKET